MPIEDTSRDVSLGSDAIAIVGAACRLPGAPDETGFRHLLSEGLCAVRSRPVGRWDVERFLHPRAATEPGFSYTFAGAYLDAPFDFDPTVFGMSPREAAQMDPQQRLLLEVVWEALEDARLPPSGLAGQEVGVYVGASSLDHANLMAADPAAIESHFMTGNTLSVISNRLSYVFDWRGPSFTVDTACSSSLVAFAQAFSDLKSGRIDTAVVAGVNMLLTPGAFIGFSRASMLSPTGLCRPFSAGADGYVRGEGAVALVLQRASVAAPGTVRAHAVAAGVNSDGRTSGIALPGLHGQRALLERLYGQAGIRPDDVAFVEAHGTGTRVGDPIEAAAIGAVLGRRRSAPLPIGSIKSNIGHLEPASGVAGLLKAVTALETRRLPRSLHLDETNPLIDFAELNLEPARDAVPLDETRDTLFAGVSSFGFGGTNAHVILASARRNASHPAPAAIVPQHLVLSAATAEALGETARAYASLLRTGTAAEAAAAAVDAGRERMRHRAVAVLDCETSTLADALDSFADTSRSSKLAVATASNAKPRLCFVFSGNGAQSVGMGRTVYLRNRAFRERFDEIDAAFRAIGAGSVKEDMFDPELGGRIGLASSVQRLIFALQSALAHALRAEGIRPDMVLGHSLGEVAAAEAAGALDLADAVRIIHARASNQELARGRGLMAVFAAGRERMEAFLDGFGREELEIAADNGPSSVTLSGAGDALKAAMREARRQRIASRALEIEYPFHSRFLDDMKESFLLATETVRGRGATLPMISTVTGAKVGDEPLDARYWWRNIREPVLFRTAIEAAAAEGATHFLEIGPRPILTGAISETLAQAGVGTGVFASLTEADDAEPHRDPVLWIAAQAKARGLATPPVSRANLGRTPPLPSYRWQRSTYRYEGTSAALNLFGPSRRHPLLGDRLAEGAPEWRMVLDTEIAPFLADHQVDGETVVAGAALLEMALAAGQELRPDGGLGIEDFDILQPLVLYRQALREVSVRHAPTSGTVEIYSRPRLGGDEWILHGRGRLVEPAKTVRVPPAPQAPLIEADAGEIYGQAAACGLFYGPAFRRALSLRRDGSVIEVALAVPDKPSGDAGFILDPASVDASLHALFQLVDVEPGVTRTYLPIRFGRLSVFAPRSPIAAATIVVERHSEQSLKATIFLADEVGAIVAEIQDVLLRSVVLSRSDPDEGLMHLSRRSVRRGETGGHRFAEVLGKLIEANEDGLGDAALVLRAVLRSAAHRSLSRLADEELSIEWDRLLLEGRISRDALSLAAVLADELMTADLAEAVGNGVRLAADCRLPSPERILRTFGAEFPDASADLVLFAHRVAALDDLLAAGGGCTHRADLLEQFTSQGIAFRPAQRLLACAARALAGGEGPIRVLVAEREAQALLSELLPDVRAGRIAISVAGQDAPRLERLRQRFGASAPLHFLLLDALASEPAFDLVLVAGWGLTPEDGADTLAHLAQRLSPDGALVVAHPPLDPTIDFILGADPDWFARSADPISPVGRMPSAGDTRAALQAAGCRGIEELPGDAAAVCFVARRPEPAVAARAERSVQLVPLGAGGRPLSQALPGRLRACGLQLAPLRDAGTLVTDTGEFVAIFEAPDGPEREAVGTALSQVSALLRRLSAESGPHRLWLVTRGAQAAPQQPAASALWSFGRVAANEHPHLDIRMVDVGPDIPVHEAADRIAAALADPGPEHERVLDREGETALRASRGLPLAVVPLPPDKGLTLEFPRRGAFDHFAWMPKPRVGPGDGEIEVEVLATGLNFRDVMLAMGLLDDDVLDGGMAGAVFGFECSGRVSRVGDGVEDLRPGDLVMGFARNAFASHVTAPRAVFMALPDGLAAEAAASIPVAFLTAWYGLSELARLRKGERVLIHGAAGGVGLAAIQIARDRGAKIIATVSTPDKRALVELLGADEVYDSRSLAFADAIGERHGGVDVVLNSLSGEAMRASLKCLKPFGRFVELGKRDYVANTELGLRPFRRNLTYFGVDLDQLIAHDPALVAEGLAHLAGKFGEGRYTPLPYRLFGSDSVGSAFRLMQSAGHVGKIVIRPPAPGEATVPHRAEGAFVPENVQLVVGGTGGFGLETALWLAGKGARTIVVASRRGTVQPPDLRIEALRERGVTFVEEVVDAADEASVHALVERTVAAHGPIGGVYHTAMVLQDGMIRTLDEDALGRVLAPKVDGSRHLDAATRSQPVRHFVLFSSISALFGNPGQGAYVAANAYLEGLARRRRAEGLPALAIGWGAISDVGVLARDHRTTAQLERISGIAGMTAAEALDRLDHILACAPGFEDPVVYCARWQGTSMIRELPIMATPAFTGFFGKETGRGEATERDLAKLLAGKSDTEAQTIVAELVAARIARILRLSVQEVDLDRPFSELGMDSLMALELSMSIEHELGLSVPLVTVISVPNVRNLSQRLLQSLRNTRADKEGVDADDLRLISMHGGDGADFSEVGQKLASRRDQVTRIM